MKLNGKVYSSKDYLHLRQLTYIASAVPLLLHELIELFAWVRAGYSPYICDTLWTNRVSSVPYDFVSHTRRAGMLLDAHSLYSLNPPEIPVWDAELGPDKRAVQAFLRDEQAFPTLRFMSHVPPHRRVELRLELSGFENTTPMTMAERKELRKWVSHGNSPLSNPHQVMKDADRQTAPMDFITCFRSESAPPEVPDVYECPMEEGPFFDMPRWSPTDQYPF